MDLTKVARHSEYQDVINVCTPRIIAAVWGKTKSTILTDIKSGYLAAHKVDGRYLVSWASCCRLYGERPHIELLDKIEF